MGSACYVCITTGHYEMRVHQSNIIHDFKFLLITRSRVSGMIASMSWKTMPWRFSGPRFCSSHSASQNTCLGNSTVRLPFITAQELNQRRALSVLKVVGFER